MENEPVLPPSMTLSKLKDLAGTLVRASLRTADTRKVVVHRLLAERDRLKEDQESLAGLLHGSAVLVKTSGDLGDEAIDHVQKVVLSLVRMVDSLQKEDEAGEGEEKNLGDMALGGVLIQLGFVTAGEVQEAIQNARGRRLGDVLVDQGRVSMEDVERAALLQQSLSSAKNKQAPTPTGQRTGVVRLGHILLRNGVVGREALDEALALQAENGVRIGEALVELGHATWGQVTDAVMEQGKHGGSTQDEADDTVIQLDQSA